MGSGILSVGLQTNFPTTFVGQTSTSVTVTISNTGTAPTPGLVLTLGGANPSDFVRQTAGDTCTGQTIAPGSCSVQYRFTPGARGLRQATLTITAGSLTPASTLFQGLGQAPAALSFASMSLSFGTGVIGTNTTTASIQLNNTGDVATGAPIFNTSPMAEFSVSSHTCGTSISPLTGCSVTLTFVPASSGTRTGTLQATASPGGSSQIVMLDGVGATAGNLSVTPNPGNFGPVLLGQSTAQNFTVSNSGGVAINNLTVSVGGTNQSSFTSVNQCGTSLAAMMSCTVRVTFTPQARGALSAFLQAVATGSTAQATLQGTGQQQAVLVPRANLSFGTVLVGQSAQLPFTLDNTGDVASGVPSFTSTDTTNFTVLPGTCNVAVPAGMSCSGNVRYSPGGAGPHSSTVGIVATPGGGTSFTASGVAQTPAALTLAPFSGSAVNYGNVLVNTAATQRFVVTNTGTQPSGPLSLAMSGTNGTLWTVGTSGTDCPQGQPLAGGASCTVDVRFLSSTNGMKSGVLTASATPGTSPTLTLTANAQNPATLTSMDISKDFGGAEVNVGSMALYTWRVTNTGDVPTGALSFTNSNASEFTVMNNTCAGTLAANTSCAVDLLFRPTASGNRSGGLTVSGTPGGTVMLAMTGKGQWRLTISVTSTGGAGGTVATLDGRLTNCGVTGCSALYDPSFITVRASPTSGSGEHLIGWQAPSGCGLGQGRDCYIVLSAHTTAVAAFDFTYDNTIFVSSITYPATFGSPQMADSQCNALATAAGINNSTNNAYFAWLSTDSSSAVARLGSGWGTYRDVSQRIVARSEASLLANALLLPVLLDEWGKRTPDSVWTGTLENGSSNTTEDCANWTSPASTLNVAVGSSLGGPGRWTVTAPPTTCNINARIYCLSRGSTTQQTLPPPPTSGKIAYVTATTRVGAPGGLAGLDAFCNANRPTAYMGRTFVALASTTTATAASRVSANANYYRPDGVYLGNGGMIAAGAINAGIWQANDLSYVAGNTTTAWTGSNAPGSTGLPTWTCNDWNDSATTGFTGRVSTVADWFNYNTLSCSTPQRVYCIEP